MSADHGFVAPATGTRTDGAKATAGIASNDMLLKIARRQNEITELLAELVNNLTMHVMVRGGEDWTTSSPFEHDFNRIEKLTGEVNDAVTDILNGEEVHPVTLQKLELPLP